MQQRLDIGLVRQSLGFREPLREGNVGLRQPDGQQPQQHAMKRVLRMFMHSHPSSPVFHFGNIARVDLIIRQRRDTFQTLAFRFRNLTVFDLLNGLVTILLCFSFAFFI
jgi:hypothetical protein